MSRERREKRDRKRGTPNYLGPLADAWRRALDAGASVPGQVHEVGVYHDDGCDLLAGRGPCNCNPEVGTPRPLDLGDAPAVPRLDDPAAMVAHLREALAGRARWIFLTDSARGHLLLSAAALGWSVGLGATALGYGLCEFFNAPTGHRGRVSFLTVPKAGLTREEVNGFLRGAGLGAQLGGDVQDVVVLGQDRPETVVAFLAAVEKGNLQVAAPQDN
jgi:hypothetical protein